MAIDHEIEIKKLNEWKKNHLVCDTCRFSANTILVRDGDKCTHCDEGKLAPYATVSWAREIKHE